MPNITYFKGFIKNISYQTYLNDSLSEYDFDAFDINASKSFGQISFPAGQIGYSKWVSPKRTRSYPFGRLYNVYNSPMRMTVIPILKDEGADGDNDRIQSSTVSWMNLLNVYIVLGYYADARKNTSAAQNHRAKLTGQKFEPALVRSQMAAIRKYKQSALHWNRSLLEDHFIEISEKALSSYEQISKRVQVPVHNRAGQRAFLDQVTKDFETFKNVSHRGSQGAASREVNTLHGLEYLSDGEKAGIEIENYLGGLYYLTVDEILREGRKFILQESKNTTNGFLPSVADIKDGLFRLILYSNLDSFTVNGKPAPFSARLNLTGKLVKGSLRLPATAKQINAFASQNATQMSSRRRALLEKLNAEAVNNANLEIEIKGNT